MIEAERFEWIEDDIANFYTALEVLYEAVEKAGGDADLVLSRYWQQKRSGEVHPSNVINNMALATDRWSAKVGNPTSN